MPVTNAATESQSHITNAPFVKRHVKRKMTEQEKIDYRRRRLLGACKDCAESKRKCTHDVIDYAIIPNVQLDDVGLVANDHLHRSGSVVEDVSSRTSLPYGNESADGEADSYISPNERFVSRERRCNEEIPNTTLDIQPPHETPLLLHKPQSPETLSAILCVESLQCEGVADAWFGEIPRRIGHNTCFDRAIAALHISCWYKRGMPGATISKVYNALASALEVLKSTMQRDGAALSHDTLGAVAALSPIEAVRTGHTLLVPTHLDGLIAILVSRAALGPLSELPKRILDYHFSDAYVTAAIRGVVSPLEALDRGCCVPCEPYRPGTPETKLRAFGNELSIRLPRLIALVRVARGRTMSATSVSSALTLAGELLQLKDEVVENGFLYLVGVAKTISPSELSVIGYSLQFKTVSCYEAGAYYWHTRAALLRLCCRLRSIFPIMCDVYSLPTHPALLVELQRLASNLVMSAEYARTLQARKRRRLFALSMLTCWGIFNDYPGVFPGWKDLEEVRYWMLERINVSLLGQPSSLSQADLDEAAELFTGGPLTGKYQGLYDSGRSN